MLKINRDRFRHALIDRRLTGYEVAGRVKVPPSHLSEMLHGKRPVPPEVVRRLERILGVEAGALSVEEGELARP